MKKITLSFIFLLSIICGCTKESESPYAVSSTDMILFNGWADTKEINISSNASWSIHGANEWCKLSTSEGKGNQVVKVSVLKNESKDNRYVILTLRGGGFPIDIHVRQSVETFPSLP